MKIFHALRNLSEFRRRYMPFLKTLEDLDLLREVGFHQEAGNPITLKVLFLQGIGSVATVQRRLSRLKRLGVVHQTRVAHDKRLVQLTLSAAVFRDYVRMYTMLGVVKAVPGRGDRLQRHSARRRRS
jgi:hypothetical protein